MRNSKTRGFTLIEAVVVLGILVILVGLTSLLQDQTLRLQEGDRVRDISYALLAAARGYAQSGTGNSDWGVAITSTTLVLFKGESYALRDTAFDDIHEIGSYVEVAGPSEIVFLRPYGMAKATGTISFNYENKDKYISINQYGAIQED